MKRTLKDYIELDKKCNEYVMDKTNPLLGRLYIKFTQKYLIAPSIVTAAREEIKTEEE